jgi:hypothetical protein
MIRQLSFTKQVRSDGQRQGRPGLRPGAGVDPDARIERALVVGDAIGEACAMTWRAITVAVDTLQAFVMSRDHA